VDADDQRATRFATIGDQRIHYEESGPEDAPALLFSHGLFLDRRMFAPQVAAFSERYRCIAWDQRGHGLTGEATGPFTFWDAADDAVGLLHSLGLDRAVHVGLSQGGFVALRVALRRPDAVRGLVLIDTLARPDPADNVAGYEFVMKVWERHGMVPDLADGLAEQLLGADFDDAALWKETWSKMRPEPFRHCVQAVLDRDDLVDRLGELDVPALVIHGEADAGIPADEGRALADALGAEFVLVPGGAHVCSLTDPAPVNAAIERFLASLDARVAST